MESDAALNPFADDVAATLERIKGLGLRVAILSDIHFDIRPAFADAGLLAFVDAFVLSFERGLMKPDPAFFAECLRDLNVEAAEALMVGDRATHDGGAAELGCPVLLLPPSRQRRNKDSISSPRSWTQVAPKDLVTPEAPAGPDGRPGSGTNQAAPIYCGSDRLAHGSRQSARVAHVGCCGSSLCMTMSACSVGRAVAK